MSCNISLASALGRSLCHGNEHHGIDPKLSNSGNHDCSTKAVFLCTADKLQCWPMFPREGFPRQTYIKQVGWRYGCNSWIILYSAVSQLLCVSPGRSLCHRNEHHGIQTTYSQFRPAWLFCKCCLSLHSCWSNCNVATCWQIELSKLSLLQLSFNIHSSNGFNCSIKFFHLKIAIGLALGESWGVACATTEKHWCPVSTFACFAGKAFLGKPT